MNFVPQTRFCWRCRKRALSPHQRSSLYAGWGLLPEPSLLLWTTGHRPLHSLFGSMMSCDCWTFGQGAKWGPSHPRGGPRHSSEQERDQGKLQLRGLCSVCPPRRLDGAATDAPWSGQLPKGCPERVSPLRSRHSSPAAASSVHFAPVLLLLPVRASPSQLLPTTAFWGLATSSLKVPFLGKS